MKIVIDSNRVLAAMIKESTTRELLFDHFFEFIAPDFILTEVQKYKQRILDASKISENDFALLVTLIFEHITIIPQEEYQSYLSIEHEIHDTKDFPYIAVCLALQAEGIWSHDPDFLQQKEVKVFTNFHLLTFSGKAKKS